MAPALSTLSIPGAAPNPYGSSIYFNTWGTEPLSMWRVASKGGPATPASSPNTGSDAYGDVSPDGRSVVFIRTENKVSHIYVASTDGSGAPRRVLETPGTVPRWSPDGKWISFSPNRGISSGIFIAHPDGTALRPLTDTAGGTLSGRPWAP